MIGLTKRQLACLDAVTAHRQATGVMPTMEELRLALGLASKSGAARLLDRLEQRGAIKRVKRRARAILIRRMKCPHCGGDLRSPK